MAASLLAFTTAARPVRVARALAGLLTGTFAGLSALLAPEPEPAEPPEEAKALLDKPQAQAAVVPGRPERDAEEPGKLVEEVGDARRTSTRRQLLACGAMLSGNVLIGVALGHSSSLIPALEAPDSEVPVDRHSSAWIASAMMLGVPLGAALAASLGSSLGRVALARLMVAPYALGMALVASASSLAQVVAGRLLLGVASGVQHSPGMLFVSEVAEKHLRGGLGASSAALATSGVLLCFGMGAAMGWRAHAWANGGMALVGLAVLLAFATESPVWLRARGRDAAAARASTYFYGDPDKVLSESSSQPGDGKAASRGLRMLFADPRGYRPLAVVHAMFVIQQVVGGLTVVSYAVPLLRDTGSTVDPYLASIVMAALRLVGCTATSLVLGRVGRRPLFLTSSLGQAAAMAVSGYATHRILAGSPVSSLWVVTGVAAYVVFGSVGWMTLPWSMMAELFPHEVRGVAQPLNSAMAHFYIFVMLQLYPTLLDLLGGAAGVQFLFCGASALSAVFVFVFLPETRGLTLAEIESYFRDNATYLSERRRRKQKKQHAPRAARAARAMTPAMCDPLRCIEVEINE